MRRFVVATSLILFIALLPGIAAAQPPDNDDLGSATPITGIPFDDSVSVGEATVEDGEPVATCAPFANTVWYAVTLAEAADVYIDTAGSNYDTTIAVWTGSSFDDLELVACNDDVFGSLQAATTFGAQPGTTYLVQVGAYLSAPPDPTLTISFGDPPKSTGKPFIIKNTFRGSTADVFVEEFDEETGTSSFRSVNLIDGRSQGKGTRPATLTEVLVQTSDQQFDESTGTFTFTDWFGSAPLEPGDFSIDRQLAEATVTKDVTLFGQTCVDSPLGFECTDLGEVQVLVDVVWTAEGPVIRSRERSADSFDGTRFRFRGTSSRRSAAVEGGVIGEIAFDLGGASGSIADVSDGFFLWNRSTGAGFFALDGPSVALAESGLAAAAQVFVDQFRGSSANAFDEEFDPETGQFSFRNVSLGIGRTKTKGGKWFGFEDVFVSSISERFDESAGSITFTEWFGSGPLDAGSIDRKLDSAAATATVTLSGITCTEVFEEPGIDCTDLGETVVTVDVSWEGVGEVSTSKSTFDSKIGSDHIRFSGRSTNRAAVANGVVAGDVVGFTLSDADGSLSRNADGSWLKG